MLNKVLKVLLSLLIVFIALFLKPLLAMDVVEVYNESPDDIYYVSIHGHDKKSPGVIGFWAKHKYRKDVYARQYIIADCMKNSYCIEQINFFDLKDKSLQGERYNCKELKSASGIKRMTEVIKFACWYYKYFCGHQFIEFKDYNKFSCKVKTVTGSNTFECNSGKKVTLWGIFPGADKLNQEIIEFLKTYISGQNLLCIERKTDENATFAQCFSVKDSKPLDIAIPLLNEGYAGENMKATGGYYTDKIKSCPL